MHTLSPVHYSCPYHSAADVLYIADLLAGFHIGFTATWDARFVTITDGPLTAWFYMRHGQFTINFLATLPVILQAIWGILLAGRWLGRGWRLAGVDLRVQPAVQPAEGRCCTMPQDPPGRTSAGHCWILFAPRRLKPD